eukprot:COSAG01_NODE_4133_length_5319_cov_102.509004_3_plen_291_part_00
MPLATVNLRLRRRRRHHALACNTTHGNVDWGRPADVPVVVVENSGTATTIIQNAEQRIELAENSDPYCSCMPSLDDADAESQLQQCSSLPMGSPPAALEPENPLTTAPEDDLDGSFLDSAQRSRAPVASRHSTNPSARLWAAAPVVHKLPNIDGVQEWQPMANFEINMPPSESGQRVVMTFWHAFGNDTPWVRQWHEECGHTSLPPSPSGSVRNAEPHVVGSTHNASRDDDFDCDRWCVRGCTRVLCYATPAKLPGLGALGQIHVREVSCVCDMCTRCVCVCLNLHCMAS